GPLEHAQQHQLLLLVVTLDLRAELADALGDLLGGEHRFQILRQLHGSSSLTHTYALFMISPKPPPPGTMYCLSSRPRSRSQCVPGTVSKTSSGERPRSRRRA